jgi:hypothetical protein
VSIFCDLSKVAWVNVGVLTRAVGILVITVFPRRLMGLQIDAHLAEALA